MTGASFTPQRLAFYLAASLEIGGVRQSSLPLESNLIKLGSKCMQMPHGLFYRLAFHCLDCWHLQYSRPDFEFGIHIPRTTGQITRELIQVDSF